jgi:hypothetical protein
LIQGGITGVQGSTEAAARRLIEARNNLAVVQGGNQSNNNQQQEQQRQQAELIDKMDQIITDNQRKAPLVDLAIASAGR